MKDCIQEDCMPGIASCQYGYPANEIHKCKFYKPEKSQDVNFKIDQIAAQLIPWGGVSLGQRDISDLAACRPLTMIGVIGLQNSGKTTLLTLLYCMLRQGNKIGNYRFAGSLTLPAWETLAYYMTWKAGNHIAFPPHTAGSVGRIPGLLHLTLKADNGHLRDILITDAKGEWFKEWSLNANTETAQTPNWIHKYSSAFILVADCDELSGINRGTTRDEVKDLFNRLNNNLDKRPVALAWAKSDIELREKLKDNLLGHLQIDGSPITNFYVSAYKNKAQNDDFWHQQVLKLFEYMLTKTENKLMELPIISRRRQNDLFLSFGIV